MTGFATLLVPLSDSETGRSALETAVLFGGDFASHLEVLHVRTDPTSAVPLVGEGMSGVMVEEMMAAAERDAAERAAAVKKLFEDCCRERGIEQAAAPAGGRRLSAAWREEVGREEEAVARRARLADMSVIGRPLPDRELPSIMTLNAALMESGRPLLVAPPKAPAALGRKVAIAWNGSAEAARAVAAALPVLERASEVWVLSVREEGAGAQSPAELVAYLGWHGITASQHAFGPGGAAGEGLLREVAAMGADLLVMGAYTHSRLRQLIMGGVTRHVLHHAEIPVLMSH